MANLFEDEWISKSRRNVVNAYGNHYDKNWQKFHYSNRDTVLFILDLAHQERERWLPFQYRTLSAFIIPLVIKRVCFSCAINAPRSMHFFDNVIIKTSFETEDTNFWHFVMFGLRTFGKKIQTGKKRIIVEVVRSPNRFFRSCLIDKSSTYRENERIRFS